MANIFDEVIKENRSGSYKWGSILDFIEKEKPSNKDEIVPLSVADMEFKSAIKIRKKLEEVAQSGLWGYSGPTQAYYDAIINWYMKRHSTKIEKDWIVQANGVVQILYSAVREFSEVGDNVLIQTPVYYPFHRAVILNKRNLLMNSLIVSDNEYKIDFKDFEEKAKISKIFILCNPHNPVGRVWKKDELEKIIKICKKYNVLIISDEIHSDIVFKPNKHIPILDLCKEHNYKNYFIASAASKTFSLAALACANLITPNEDIRTKMNERINLDGIYTYSVFGMQALITGYNECEDWYLDMLDYVEDNFKYLKKFMSENFPKSTVYDMQGTYLAWVDFNFLNLNNEDLESFMTKDAYLFLDEGYIFGKEGNGFERFNLACPRSILVNSLERLKKAAIKRGFI